MLWVAIQNYTHIRTPILNPKVWLLPTFLNLFLCIHTLAATHVCPQAKLQIAVALWTGNALRPAFAQWRSVVRRRSHLRVTAGVVARRWRNLELTGKACPALGPSIVSASCPCHPVPFQPCKAQFFCKCFQ